MKVHKFTRVNDGVYLRDDGKFYIVRGSLSSGPWLVFESARYCCVGTWPTLRAAKISCEADS